MMSVKIILSFIFLLKRSLRNLLLLKSAIWLRESVKGVKTTSKAFLLSVSKLIFFPINRSLTDLAALIICHFNKTSDLSCTTTHDYTIIITLVKHLVSITVTMRHINKCPSWVDIDITQMLDPLKSLCISPMLNIN